jgi:hypothetical protein
MGDEIHLQLRELEKKLDALEERFGDFGNEKKRTPPLAERLKGILHKH